MRPVSVYEASAVVDTEVVMFSHIFLASHKGV